MDHNFLNRPCPMCRAVGMYELIDGTPHYMCRQCKSVYQFELPKTTNTTNGPTPPLALGEAAPVIKRGENIVTDYLTTVDLMGNKHRTEVTRYTMTVDPPPDVAFNPHSPQVEWVLYFYKDRIRNRKRYNKSLIKRKVNAGNDSEP
jgi:hypothetical protein